MESSIPRWLRSPHLQTIGAAFPLFTSAYARAKTDDVRIPMPEAPGCFLHARAWWQEKRAPMVVILHGIGGSGDSHCCMRAAVALHQAGYHVARLDMRGAGNSAADVPSLYHAGLTRDLDTTVHFFADDARVANVLVLGFSGGGSVALKLAGEWGESAPPFVRGVASVSAPLDYTIVAARMDTLRCLPYRFHVLRSLLERSRAFAELHPLRAHYRVADLSRIKKFRTYDGEIIAPMHGFDCVDRYYREASSGPWLAKVRVPTVLVHADDDPMVPGSTVRPWIANASSSVRAHVTPHGGHIGWLAGVDEEKWIQSWATRRVVDFFDSLSRPS